MLYSKKNDVIIIQQSQIIIILRIFLLITDFKYNHEFHNVIEVSRQDYELCNSSLPILTYTTGHDSIEIKSAGHHYFLCGNPGHCDAGQKLGIFVHCDDGGNYTGLSPPDHRSISPSLVDNLSLIHVALWYFVWHEFV